MQRSGIIAISGQPNVGKSTLLNGFLGEKVAITTPKPETTRDVLRGILTDKDAQMIFIDTPGIHKPHDLLGKVMLSRAQSSLMEADIILFVTEKRAIFNADDENIFRRLPSPKGDKTVILIINKTDKVKDKSSLLPLMKKATERYPFDEIVPISAFCQKDLDRLLVIIKSYLPEGPFLYPEDQLTDKGNRFLIQEIIREKIILQTYEEIPHSVAVSIDDIHSDEDDTAIKVFATIYVERMSQKAIIIGKNGDVIKKIGQLARKELKNLLGKDVHLDLWVKVYEKWKKDPNALEEMGYVD